MPKTAQTAEQRRQRNMEKVGKAVVKEEALYDRAAKASNAKDYRGKGEYDGAVKRARLAYKNSDKLADAAGGATVYKQGDGRVVTWGHWGEDKMAEARDLTKSQKYR